MEQANHDIEEVGTLKYNETLEGVSSELQQKTKALFKESLQHPEMGKRSERKFLNQVCSWETGGLCTEEDFYEILGWYLEDENDLSWEKLAKTLTPEQRKRLEIPNWIGNGGPYSAYEDKGYEIPGGSSYADPRDKREY